MGLAAFNRMRREQAEQSEGGAKAKPDTDPVDATKLSAGKLKEHLTSLGIEFEPNATKAQMLKLLPEA